MTPTLQIDPAVYFTKDPRRAQQPQLPKKDRSRDHDRDHDHLDDLTGPAAPVSLSAHSEAISLKDAFYTPRLYQAVLWISALSTTWISLRNFHLVFVLTGFAGCLVLNWIMVPTLDLGPFTAIIVVGGALLGSSLTFFVFASLLAPFFDFEGLLTDAFRLLHPTKLRTAFLPRGKLWLTVGFLVNVIASVALYGFYFVLSIVGIMYPVYSQASSILLFLVCIFSYPVFACAVLVIMVTPAEIYLLIRLIDMNFEVLRQAGIKEGADGGGEEGDAAGGDLEATLDRFLFLHSRTVMVVKQYSTRKQWHYLLILFFGITGTLGSALVTTYTLLDPGLNIDSQLLAAITSTTLALLLLVPTLTFCLLKKCFDDHVSHFYRSRVVLTPDLRLFHEVGQYLDRVPLEIEIFGIGVNIKLLLFSALPLIVSSFLSLVRLFV